MASCSKISRMIGKAVSVGACHVHMLPKRGNRVFTQVNQLNH